MIDKTVSVLPPLAQRQLHKGEEEWVTAQFHHDGCDAVIIINIVHNEMYACRLA